MELHDNRTELERMLAGVWEYEDPGGRKTSLPKWLFAVTLTGTFICTYSPSDLVAPVMTAFTPGREMLSVDRVSSESVAEDLDYRIARRSESPAGWRAFIEAHPDGPHAQAAQAEIDRLLPAPPPQPAEVAEQSPPSPAATQTQVEAGQSPAAPAPPPIVVEKEPAPPPQPAEVAEQSPPSPAATQTPVMAEKEPTRQPVEAAATTPLPQLRPHQIAVAKSVERAHRGHWRAEHRQANQPNAFTVLVAQLFHGHRRR